MRTLAIGDIHGCRKALEYLLHVVSPTPTDVVVTLGDYVDRGPDSRGVIDTLIALRGEIQLITLKGNHEIMMESARSDSRAETGWMNPFVGGDATMESYGTCDLDEIPESHWDFIADCAPSWENESHLFVHANVEPHLSLEDQPADTLYWDRFDNRGPHISGKIMICGHTSQRSGVPVNLGHAVCIDTAAYNGQWLTCLDASTGQYWQANEEGDLREYELDPPLVNE